MREFESSWPVCVFAVEDLSPVQLAEIQWHSGHPGVRCTLYFVLRINLSILRGAVRLNIQSCEQCQSIELATVQWLKRGLGVHEIWDHLGMNITHYNHRYFLTLIDCCPTQFSIWFPLFQQYTAHMIQQLESVFFERGSPMEILIDNDTAFCSQQFRWFVDKWGI